MPRHTARAVVLHDGQLLLMERWRPSLHYFSIPGGGIEPGETPEQTVIREVTEETGCQVTLGRKLYLLIDTEGAEHHIFWCDYVSGTPGLPADSPEALKASDDNRFKPGWVPVDDISLAWFKRWEPVREQLLKDLAQGFSAETVVLRQNMVP